MRSVHGPLLEAASATSYNTVALLPESCQWLNYPAKPQLLQPLVAQHVQGDGFVPNICSWNGPCLGFGCAQKIALRFPVLKAGR